MAQKVWLVSRFFYCRDGRRQDIRFDLESLDRCDFNYYFGVGMKNIISVAALVILLGACGADEEGDAMDNYLKEGTIEQVEAKPQNNYTETVICYFGPNVVRYVLERAYRSSKYSYFGRDELVVENGNGKAIAYYSQAVPCVIEKEYHD